MARPIKKKVEFTGEALQNLLQNIWSEAEETGVKATTQYGKQNRNINDNQDIALISKINSEYLKIRNSTTETKMSVARLVKDIVYKDSVGNQIQTPENNKLEDDDKERIFKMINEQAEKENIELIKPPHSNNAPNDPF